MLNIIKGKIARPVKAVFYGPEGIGKSTMASNAPDPLFIDVEGGTAQLDVNRVEPPKTWDELITIVKEVAASPGICKTLVIDTADWAEMLCVKYICQKYKQNSLEGFGYGKGYTILQEEFAKVLEALDLVITAGMNVIITAHAKMRKQELPDEAGAFDRWEMKLTRQVAPMLKEWADALLFFNYKTYVVAMENDTKKAQGGKRVMYTSHHPCWDAKNRDGLPEEMDMDFSKIAQLFAGTAPKETPMDKLKKLMSEAEVTDAEVQKVVSDKGHYPADKSITEYEEKFISGWLIAHWDQILPLIKQNRNQ